jgi:hypothetical protein
MSSPVPSTSAILANVAPSLFQAGPKDVVATPDIYNLSSSQINSNQTVNTSVGKFNPFNSSLINNLTAGALVGGVLASLTGVGNLTTLAGAAASLTNTNTVARLSSAMGISPTAMSATFQAALNQSINLNSNNYNSMLVTSNGSTVAVSTTDVAGTTQLLNTVNQIAGTTVAAAIDVGAQTSAASAITSTLISLGLSTVLGGFIATQTTQASSSQSVAQVALQQNVEQAIQASDLTTVQLCITQLGVGGVLQQVPNAALQLLQYFQIPSGTVSSGYAALWTQLQAILVQLAPTWKTTQINGQTQESLQYYINASSDCRTVMLTDTDPNVIAGATIGGSFPQEGALATLQQMYPNMLTL